MGLVTGVWLAVLGVLGASNLIIARKPDAKEMIAKLAPYQGWIGAISALCGRVVGAERSAAPLDPGGGADRVDHLAGDGRGHVAARLPARPRRLEELRQGRHGERQGGRDDDQAGAVSGHARPHRHRPRRVGRAGARSSSNSRGTDRRRRRRAAPSASRRARSSAGSSGTGACGGSVWKTTSWPSSMPSPGCWTTSVTASLPTAAASAVVRAGERQARAPAAAARAICSSALPAS